MVLVRIGGDVGKERTAGKNLFDMDVLINQSYQDNKVPIHQSEFYCYIVNFLIKMRYEARKCST